MPHKYIRFLYYLSFCKPILYTDHVYAISLNKQACSVSSCICTTTNGQNHLACVSCLVEVAPSIISDAQDILDGMCLFLFSPSFLLLFFPGFTYKLYCLVFLCHAFRSVSYCSCVLPVRSSSRTTSESRTIATVGAADTSVPEPSASSTSVLNPLKKGADVPIAVGGWGWVVGVFVGAVTLGLREIELAVISFLLVLFTLFYFIPVQCKYPNFHIVYRPPS